MYQRARMLRTVVSLSMRRIFFWISGFFTGTSERIRKPSGYSSISSLAGSGWPWSPKVARWTKAKCALSKLFSMSRRPAQFQTS